MRFDDYQKEIIKYDIDAPKDAHDPRDPGFMTKVLGVGGEAGEVQEKFKKILRDKDGQMTEEDKGEIVKELGDVLWYLATIARYLDVPFSEVAKKQLEKAQSRLERGKLGGSGDNR